MSACAAILTGSPPEYLYTHILDILLKPSKFLIIHTELISPPLNHHYSCKLTHLYPCSINSTSNITSLQPAVPTLLWKALFFSRFICHSCWQHGPTHPLSTLPHQRRVVSWFVFSCKSITNSLIAKSLSVMVLCFCFCHWVSIHLSF